MDAIAALLEPPPPPVRDVNAAVRSAARVVAPPGVGDGPSRRTINTDRAPL